MLERALPIRHSPVADKSAVRNSVDTGELFRKLRDRLLWLLRVLADLIAKGGPLS